MGNRKGTRLYSLGQVADDYDLCLSRYIVIPILDGVLCLLYLSIVRNPYLYATMNRDEAMVMMGSLFRVN